HLPYLPLPNCRWSRTYKRSILTSKAHTSICLLECSLIILFMSLLFYFIFFFLLDFKNLICYWQRKGTRQPPHDLGQ
ncbi:hypothetical protein PoMZ_02235, partial [Pyricularia oryzae]